jgi:hypothetical protein
MGNVRRITDWLVEPSMVATGEPDDAMGGKAVCSVDEPAYGGTFRTSPDFQLGSGMRAKADVRQPL